MSDEVDLGLDPWVRDILRCPSCGSTLRAGARPDGAVELVCTGEACALAYPVRDGIPVLLLDEAYPASGTV
ncbi:MAG TPA: Trm112 family protein [Actinotalea sp.]